MDQANVVIIGGGVVGCAIARELSASTSDVFLLEQLPKLGMATSTRNSGVIHSGIYYPPGSLKARLCVAGNILTKEFCARHSVPHRNCGKLVVASHDSEIGESSKPMAAPTAWKACASSAANAYASWSRTLPRWPRSRCHRRASFRP